MLGDNEQDRYGEGPLDHPAGRGPSRDALVRGGYPTAYPSYEWYEDDVQKAPSFDLQKYIRIMQRHWMIITAAVILAAAGGIASVLLTTKIYTADATIKIDKETAKVANIQDFEAPQTGTADEFLQTQFGLLRSRSLAEATAKDPRLDLARNKALIKAIGLEPGKGEKPLTTAETQTAIANFIQGNLSVMPDGKSRLVHVSIDSPSPTASALLANAVAQNFIDTSLARKFDSTAYARQALQSQLAAEKAKLETAERQLADYARSQQIINMSEPSASADGTSGSSAAGNQSLAASSLSAMLSALNEAQTARIRAEQRWRLGQAASANSREILQSAAIQELKSTRAQLESEYQKKLAAGYLAQHPDMVQLREQMTGLDRQIETEARTIQNTLSAGLKNDYEVALAQENQLRGQVERLKGQVLDVRGRSIDYDILKREVDTSRQLYDILLQGFREIGVASNLGATNISIIDPARPPNYASKPRPLRTMLTAIILGLALGIGLAFLFESFDESIRSPEDVENKLGLPLLGTIPKLDKGTTPVVALLDPRSNFSEAYYSVRTALQFSTNEGVPSSLVVTSARPSEGKSTTSTAIAQHLARLGLRVLLVDSDLRNPSLHKVMSAENTHGFSNYLTGGMSLIQLAQETSIPGLAFIPCGPMPPNPAELLGAAKLAAMLREARAHYDVVLIDAPPVMGLADAPLLASAAAGTILVVEAGGTGRRLAKSAIRRLQVGSAHLIGILLTKFDARKSSYGYGYGYAYDYEYGSRPALKADS